MDAKRFLHWVRLLLNQKQRKARMIDSETIIRMMVAAEKRMEAR